MCCYFFLFNYFWKFISNFWVKIASTPFFFLTPNVMVLTHTYTQQLSGSSTPFSLWPISTSKHGLFVYRHTAANVIRVVDISQGWAWGAVLTGPLSSGEVSDKDCRRLNTPLPAVRRPFLSYLHAVFHGEACKESLMSKHFLKLQPRDVPNKQCLCLKPDPKDQYLPAVWLCNIAVLKT